MHRFRMRIDLIPLAAALLSSPGFGAEKIVPIDTAAQMIESLAGRIGNARWDVTWADGTFAPDGKFTPSFVGCQGTVTYEPSTERYRVEVGMTVKSSPEPVSSMRNDSAFDGQRARQLMDYRPGANVPPVIGAQPGANQPPRRGTVHENSDEFMEKFATAVGIGNFPPHFRKRRLPDLIRGESDRGRPVRVTSDDNGLWHIKVVDDDSAKSDLRIAYDTAKGVVVEASWANGEPRQIWREVRVQLQQVDGFWLPKQVDTINTLDGTGARVVFKNMRLNLPIGDEEFRIKFPAGVRVIDYADKKAYTVGQSDKDEQALIRAFVQESGIAIPTQVPVWRRIVPIVLVAALVMVAFAVAVRTMRRRGAAGAVVISFFACVAAGAHARQLQARQPGPPEDDSLHLTQCGFQVTVCVMEMFGVKYDVRNVSSALSPSKNGISLAAIREILEAHKLKVHARQSFTVADLKKALEGGTVVIIPVEGRPNCYYYEFGNAPATWNHFVIACRHPTRGHVIVDVPHSIIALESSGLKDQHLRDPKRAVLFIGP